MADLITSVEIRATENVSPAYDAAIKANEGFVASVANMATSVTEGEKQANDAVDATVGSFQRVRNQQEQIERDWIDAIKHNTDLIVEEEAKRLKAIQDAADKAAAAEKSFGETIGNSLAHPLQAAGDIAKGFIAEVGMVGTVALGAAAGLTLLATEGYGLVKAEGEEARSTQNLAYRLNLTFEETKRLSEMAALVNVNIDSLARVSIRLADALEHPATTGKKVSESLKSIGVEGNTSGQLLLGMLEKLAAIPDATERIEKAGEILGKRQAAMLQPLIADWGHLAEVIDQLGGHVDESLVKNLLAANEQINTAGVAWDRFKESLAAKIAPIVIKVIPVLTDVLVGKEATEKSIDAEIARVKKQIEENAKKELAAPKEKSGDVLKGEKPKSLGDIFKGESAGSLFGASGLEGASRETAELQVQLKLLQAQKEQFAGIREAKERSEEYNKQIDKGYQESADRFKAAHAHDADVLKESLSQAEKVRKESMASLESGKLGPEEQVAANEKLLKSTEDIARLKKEIATASQDPARTQEAELSGALAHQKHLIELERTALAEKGKTRRDFANEQLSETMALNERELKVTLDSLESKRALELKKPVASRDTTIDNQEQAARDKKASEDQKAGEKYREEIKKSSDELDRAETVRESGENAHQKRMTELVIKGLDEQLTAQKINADQWLASVTEAQEREFRGRSAGLSRKKAEATNNLAEGTGKPADVETARNAITALADEREAARQRDQATYEKDVDKKAEADRKLDDLILSQRVAHEARMLAAEKDRLNAEVGDAEISAAKRLALSQEAENAEFKAAMDALNAKAANVGGSGPADRTDKQKEELQKLLGDMEKLYDEHNLRMQEFSEKAAKELMKPYDQAIDKIAGEFDSGFARMASGQQGLEKAFYQTGRNIELNFVTSQERMLTKFLATQLKQVLEKSLTIAQMDAIDSASGLKKEALYIKDFVMFVGHEIQKLFAHKAAKAAEVSTDVGAAATAKAAQAEEGSGNAGLATSAMGLAATEAAAEAAPEGPEAAIAAGATIVAALTPYVTMAGAGAGVSSAAQGWDVPGGQGLYPALLHPNEKVLSASFSQKVEKAAAGPGGGNGDTHNHLYMTIPPGAKSSDIDNTLDHLRQLHKSGRTRFLFSRN
jgi:hypothetical protein